MGDKPALNSYTLLGMGVTTAVCVVGGFAGGRWLDEQFKTGVLFAFLGLAVGIVVAALTFWARLKKNL
ncbi:MAG: AtpZ/AtpI family protein [Acidimicrobiales bacterium]